LGKHISKRHIDTWRLIEGVQSDSAGGVVVFMGTVRNTNNGVRVKGLEYQVYARMAEQKMKEIEAETRKRWPVKKMKMIHREGRLSVGEVSVVVAVSCEHRGDAFEACRFAIDRIKETLPLWKNEQDSRGKKSWVKGTPIEA
jgi:molybdopterin synthase catalytic subunit